MTNSIETLTKLQKKMDTCTACPLAFCGRKQVVHGKGTIHPDFFLIGEAPGAQEDLEGRPFVGRSGQLLRKKLTELLPKTTTYYVSNTVKCRPPQNRTPTIEERNICSSIGIFEELALVDPLVIITIGAVAFSMINPEGGPLMKARLKTYKYNSIPVVPILHPAYCLRFPSKISDFETDIRFAYDTLEKQKFQRENHTAQNA